MIGAKPLVFGKTPNASAGIMQPEWRGPATPPYNRPVWARSFDK
jgi:hypothetical protein